MSKAILPGPAAGFDHPIDILDGCHERIRRQCTTIARIAEHLAAKGADDEAREAARNVMRYFDTAGANHHRDEEEDLFPALLAAAPEASTRALVERLQADHVRLDGSWKEMRARLERLAVDAEAARAFAASYDRHIALEEAELLPLARRVLDAKALARMGERMAGRRGVRPSSGT